MSAPAVPVKTMEPVKTSSITTNANVLLDLTEQIVKTVRTFVTILLDNTLQNGFLC